ncbi:hypothetical protein L207DRAFT_416786 [Hyaloscypha variabilis F]|uniref:F-box domain-containing protein n=1 Tax=Hyaloscypha variabilis (strain UAMH 11265 / GT02V1 / F) TaxID=1149755 RepID=A0A2J6SB43_HYAVF|nr:hypothetical protein L207DRAFT_416786 [Hyaloscypha variabilis F]
MAAPPTAAPAKKVTILDLPSETQKDIFKHASSTDLIALSLVSKHFRDIAAEQLYRSFHIVFPDEDDPSNDSPIDGLAGGLDTFVTSEYDYAKYLREIVLETLSGGDKGERAYRHYLYDVSCGKFMNTLLLLTLRKARALETFRWDIRVELSRQVFKELHQIQALQHLHLRMQVGHSIYQTPPALAAPPLGPIIIDLTLPPPPHHNAPMIIPLQPTSPIYGDSPSNSFSLGNQMAAKLHKKNTRKITESMPYKKPPPTISGFKNLKTLSILDMDTLDYVHELKTCIRNCSPTLNTLKLSFSEALANKSRKPPPEVQSDDDSDQEDEFGQIIVPTGPPPPMGGASDPNGPTKAFKAAEEKKKQEAVLGKIFNLDAPVLSKPNPPPPPPKQEVSKESKPEEDPKRRFIRNLAPVAAKLMAHVKPGSDLTDEGKETLSMIERAAKMYIDSIEKGKEKETGEASGSSTAKATPASSSAGMDDATEEDTTMSGAAASGPGLFDNETDTKRKRPTSTESGVSDPDEINIEEPEGELAIEEGAPETTPEETVDSSKAVQEESSSAAIDAIGWANKLHVLDHHIAIRNSHEEIEREGEKLKKRMEEFKLKLQSGNIQDADYKVVEEAEAEFKRVALRVEELSRNMQEVNDEIDDLKANSKEFLTTSAHSKMIEYVRSTRGLTLNTLAIYLIPIKASVIARAIDVNVLQSLTLLNVGPQIPFWNLLVRENKSHPLPLRKIYTDNVTLPFLTLVGQLDMMTELFMLERNVKTRVESTAAKTTVTIEHIRKIALKKHAGTLKILMIRNDFSMDWDLNVKTAMLLCQRAKHLEELACSYGFRVMHTLTQFFNGLTSLRALHTIQLRSEDNCHTIHIHSRKFIVDMVANNPQLKLEYIALVDNVERLVRRKPSPKSSKLTDKKGKGKASLKMDNTSKALAELIIGLGPSSSWGEGSGGSNGTATPMMEWQDSSDDEEMSLGGLGNPGLKIETIEGIRFCDVGGVRIFEKDILAGRL